MEGIQTTYDLADRGGNGLFGNEGIWLFAILALMWGGNGFGFGGQGGRYATVEDINTSANFTRLENQAIANANDISRGFTNLGNGICDLGFRLATDFGELSKEIASCCCDVKQISLENRYLAAQNTAEINANVTAQIQSVKDLIFKEKAEQQAARIQQLELNQALCGVVRYPTQMSYCSPCNPFCGCGYGQY